MTQRRYFNSGAAISAGALNEVFSKITTKGVLGGGDTFVIQPNILVIDPIALVFPSGVVLNETENTQVVIPFSSVNRSFTITYRHNDTGLIGGTGAVLQAELGFIDNDDPALSDGLAIAYVKYPGSGPLLQTHIYEAPKATIDATVTIGDGDYRLPPFGEGFLLSPAMPTVVPVTSDANTFATYLYTNLGGNLLFKATASGAGGNALAFGFTDTQPASSPETIVQVSATQFEIKLAKNGGGTVISSNNSMFAFLTTPSANPAMVVFQSLVAVTQSGTGGALIGVFPVGNTGSDFQNLSGGITNKGITYEINNITVVAVTHTLKWVFVARTQPPHSIVLEFSLGGASTISLVVTDTNGVIVTLDAPTDLIQSSGLTRRTVRITDGNFISGQRYFVQATILTQAGESSSVTFVGASHYNRPF